MLNMRVPFNCRYASDDFAKLHGCIHGPVRRSLRCETIAELDGHRSARRTDSACGEPATTEVLIGSSALRRFHHQRQQNPLERAR
jgi:hypothetical protein